MEKKNPRSSHRLSGFAPDVVHTLRHKRKVQNFLPCKTPTRGGPPHLDATGVSAAHSVTYEDPDVHLGHHPLVMRHHHHHHHHHNMELHAKQIHYPSGYPMPRSPPLFICSSPGPDPYRSHDNVYEELEHGHGRDTDSEPPIQSDDDFAEDELSLPGDRSFHKSPSDGTTVATIYHDRSNGGGSSNSAATTASTSTVPAADGGAAVAGGGVPGGYLDRGRTERNSLLSSSSSSGNDNNHPLHPRHGAGGGGGGGSGGGGGGGAGGPGGGPPQPGANGGSNGGNSNNNGSNGSSSASNSNRNSNSSTDCVSSHSGNNNTNGSTSNNNNNSNSSASGNSNANIGTPTTGIGGSLSSGLGLFRSRKHHPATLGGSGRRGGGSRGGEAGHHFGANVPTASLDGGLVPDGGPLGGDPVVLPPMYDERALMTLPPPAYHHAAAHHQNHPQHQHHHHHPAHLHLNGVNNNNGPLRSNYYSTIDDDLLDPVERRNRINAQLSASSGVIHHGPGGGGGVSTIFRNGHRAPCPPHGINNNNNSNHSHHPSSVGGRSRTNPRSSDRRGRNALQLANGNGHGGHLAVISTPDPSQYIYHEPVFHEGLIYDGCLSHTYSDRSGGSGSTGTGSTGGMAYPYILPQFTTFRNGGGAGVGGPPAAGAQSLYSRDSSFGSDSGYSQHTQTSNRSGAGWSQRRPVTQCTTSGTSATNTTTLPGGGGPKSTGPLHPKAPAEQQLAHGAPATPTAQAMVDS
uniref:Uncharacterized protein n=1 Tax=Anopheles atroparvus TaxID=41427 RepID=A0A182IS00_ANOAO